MYEGAEVELYIDARVCTYELRARTLMYDSTSALRMNEVGALNVLSFLCNIRFRSEILQTYLETLVLHLIDLLRYFFYFD